MTRKSFICSLTVLFILCGFLVYGIASDKGPAEMQLISSTASKQPPAQFPHHKHQELLTCGDCHHGMVDGKMVPYSEGMAIQKCESCHNTEVLAGKTKGKDKLDTFHGAGHASCLECHKEAAKNDESKKDLKSCKTCHKK